MSSVFAVLFVGSSVSVLRQASQRVVVSYRLLFLLASRSVVSVVDCWFTAVYCCTYLHANMFLMRHTDKATGCATYHHQTQHVSTDIPCIQLRGASFGTAPNV